MSYDKAHAKALGADCEHCPLDRGGKFCPSGGAADANVAFVGEAPAVQDAREGTPFVGPTGRLLRIISKKAGIKWEEVFLTNAVLCRAPDGGPPPKAAISACRPRLLKELQPVHPEVVVALGNPAALGILGTDGVTSLRVGPGRSSPYPELQGVRVIPTVNPAICFRQPDMFPNLVKDIGKVDFKDVNWNPPNYVVLDDPVEAVKELRYIEQRASHLVIDIEVDIEKDGAGFGHPNQYGLLCVGVAYARDRIVVFGEGACADESVRDAMADAFSVSKLVGQNGKFDLAGVNPVIGSVRLWFDTMLASYCMDERAGVHGLEYNGTELLGAPMYKNDVKQYVGKGDGYGVIPRPILYKYNATDVAVTWDLWIYFTDRLEVLGLRELHDFLVMVSNELIFLELNGLAVDREYAYTLSEQYTKSLAVIEENLNQILIDAGYQKINPRSPIQVKAALLFLRVRVASTDEDTLKTIIEKVADPDKPVTKFCETLLLHRREAKMFGTYVKGTIKRLYRGRVYPTFLLHGTTTGRLACRNPNLQNVPRESAIKRLFIPGRPENVFVQADYAQAELRVLTWLAQDEYFRELLNDDSRDFFDELTPRLYRTNPTKEQLGDAAWKELRIRVKAFVYGLGYGRKHFSIAAEFKMSDKEALEMKNNFFALIPGIADWQQRIKQQVAAGDDLINPFGRHRRFHLITQENWDSVQNEALAFLPQSTSSDVCLRAMVGVRRELRGSGAFIRNIVHDSILVDSPPDMADDVARILDHHMVASGEELVGDYVKFKTDYKIGKNWGEV